MQSEEDLISYVGQVVESSREYIRRLSISDASPEGLALEAQQSGVTIDLGHRSMSYVPEPVVDAMKDDIERLAISHNSLTGFPEKLGECVRLRYLNARYNKLREFPSPILKLSSLEILDLSRNRLKLLPTEISQLSSLKVLAISRNLIERLPLSVGEMNSLRVLKLDHNPLIFPPSEVYTLDTKPSNFRHENEEVLTTTKVKRFLRDAQRTQKQITDSVPPEGPLSLSSDPAKRPRRVAAGTRFPVRPSLSGFESLETTAAGAAPPLPARSHFRERSIQPNRPSASPSRSELPTRTVSRSESVQSTTIRTRRMGIVNDRAPDLNFLEGIVGGAGPNGYSPPSQVADLSLAALLADPQAVMTSESRLLQAANRLVFAYRQLRPLSLAVVQHMQSVGHTGFDILSSVLAEALEAAAGLAELVMKYEPAADSQEVDRPSGIMRRIQSQCRICFEAGSRLWSGFAIRSREIAKHCPRGLLRTFTLCLFAVLVETRDSMAVLGISLLDRPVSCVAHPVQPPYSHSVDRSKIREASQRLQQRPSHSQLRHPHHAQHDLPHSEQPCHTITPRHYGSYIGNHPDGRQTLPPSSAQADHLFAQLYVRLKSTTTLAQSSIPELQHAFSRERDILLHHPDASGPAGFWARLAVLAERLLAATVTLSQRLAGPRARDPVLRQDAAFWALIRTYCDAWYDLVAGIQDSGLLGPLQTRIRVAMKPLHRANKELILAIDQSPWRDMLTGTTQVQNLHPDRASQNDGGRHHGSQHRPHDTVNSSMPVPGSLPHSHLHTTSDAGYVDYEHAELRNDPGSDGDSFCELSVFPPDSDSPATTVQTPLTSMLVPQTAIGPTSSSSSINGALSSAIGYMTGSAFSNLASQPLASPALSALVPSPSLLPAMPALPTGKPYSSNPAVKAAGIPAKPAGAENEHLPVVVSSVDNLGVGSGGNNSGPTALSKNSSLVNSQFPTRTNSLRR